jgi:hypothetical protein
MPVVRLTKATWDRLTGYARPLEDSPDDVIRRALDALDASTGKAKIAAEPETQSSSKRSRKHTGESGQSKKVPQKEFRIPLLQTLAELGGRASIRDVRKNLKPRIEPILSEADYQVVSSGDPRWWNATCWQRYYLVRDGFLLKDSDRGVWELSPQGKAFIQSLDPF